MVCKRDGGSPTVRFHMYLLLKLSLMFVILRLDSFPLLVFPNSLSHIIRLFQRAPLGEKLRNLGLSFLCVKWRYSYVVHCFQRSVMKLKECDISLKWKAKAKIICKERQGEIGFQKLLLTIILVSIDETRGHCLPWLLWNLKPDRFGCVNLWAVA